MYNAGVTARGGIDHIALDNWRWILDVNLAGVSWLIGDSLSRTLKNSVLAKRNVGSSKVTLA